MKYTGEDIYKAIPNRKPFMILDTLEVFEETATSILDLCETQWFFQCHYPGNPILPMTLLVESMTQTFSAIFLSKGPQEIPVLASIGPIRLKEGATPNDEIKLEAELKSFKRGVAKGVCKAFKNGSESPILEIEIVEILPSKMIKLA